jgi:hypothetical protein
VPSPEPIEIDAAWREAFEGLGILLGDDPRSTLASVRKIILAGMLKKRVPAKPICARLTTLAPLAACTSLRELDLTASPVSDLRPLSELRSLASLTLWQTRVSDLGPLAGMHKLSRLMLWCCPVHDLGPLASNRGLVALNVEYTGVVDLAPLRGLTGLRELNVSGTRVVDLSPLASVPLTSLVAHRTDLTEAELERFRSAHPACDVQVGDQYPAREVRCGC